MATTSSVTELPEFPAITTEPEAAVVNPAEQAATIAPAVLNVNQPTDTVSGQMTTLLDQNSDYMKSAKTSALQGMNSKGLINSSMAVGASQKAAIDSALPIAQQDAQTYYDKSKFNTSAENTFLQNQQAFDMNKALKEQEQRLILDRMNYEQINKVSFANLENELAMLKDNNAANLQMQIKEVESNLNISSAMKQIFATEVSKLIESTQTAIKEIGFSDKSPEQQANAVAQMLAQRDASINLLQQLALSTQSWSW